jgi:hypothetical protein
MTNKIDIRDDRVVAIFEDEEYMFDKDELLSEFGSKRTDQELTDIAYILAANLESPDMDMDGCIEIDEINFNDCFEDMMEDIRDMF